MTPIEKALKTWYPTDHPLHNDPLHPAIGLAGEAGELLNLHKKERFKEGFSWWDCVHCGYEENNHTSSTKCLDLLHVYTPKILDELGDFWYYLRILAYQQKVDLSDYADNVASREMIDCLINLSSVSANILRGVQYKWKERQHDLGFAYVVLLIILDSLDCTLDQLTELNWQKLKDGNNNGWQATAAQLDKPQY